MSANFFITGLPRSRTAWLANLFTTGDQVCHHDLLGKVRSLEHFRRRMGVSCGDSDSGLVWLFPQLREIYPRARWLWVERNLKDVLASVERVARGTQWATPISAFLGSTEFWLPQYLAATEVMLKDSRVARLPFWLLDDFDSVSAAWRFLCPHSRLSRDRFEFLNALRVEVMPDKVPLSVAAAVIEEIKAAGAHFQTDLCQLV